MTPRAETWLRALVSPAEFAQLQRRHGVLHCDATLNGEAVRYIAVVPDPENPYPRARGGEVGLLQGCRLAQCVREAISLDAAGPRRGIIALVDTPSQAYGRTEEALCISLALAAAVDAYASARMAGHASITLILGKAFSGALLAHGYQASRILALDAPTVQVQAMGKSAAMRITRRTEQELDAAAAEVPPMAYDLKGFSRLEILHAVVPCHDAESPSQEDAATARQCLADALRAAQLDGPDLAPRMYAADGHGVRSASRQVRTMMQEMWAPKP